MVIFSCFGNPGLEQFERATRLLYLGENVRPDFSIADYSLTFDMSNYCGRNIYVPLWFLRSKQCAARSADYHPFDPAELEDARPVNQGKEAVAYIGNNSTPTRMEAVNELTRLGIPVDCYGSQTRAVSSKIDTLARYRYTLCFENTYTPGYVTEKILDSFLAGSIPIYWGGAPPNTFNLDTYFVCCPYHEMTANIKGFMRWKEAAHDSHLPPLLRRGAFKKLESTILLRLAKLILDLF